MLPMSHSRKSLKIAFSAAKVLFALGIIGYLLTKIQSDAGFSRLYNEPKHWPFLALSVVVVLTAFSLSFVRWYLLVRGLDLQFHFTDALRLGSLGFMLNQVMPGSVGGDLFKAAFLAHEQPGRRTEAVATVLIDRAVGLVAILMVASIGLIFADRAINPSPLLSSLQVFIWSAASVGLLGMLLLTSRLVSGPRIQGLALRVPAIGHPLSRLVSGLSRFNSHPQYLTAALVLAVATHSLLVTAIWCVGHGLPINGPTLQQCVVIVPLALVAGAMPLTPGGLGLTETALAKLFAAIGLHESDGAMVALGYRAITYIVAGIGACYYLSAKRRIDRLLQEAEELAQEIDK
jgi:glycosyltransferase 2 family protein